MDIIATPREIPQHAPAEQTRLRRIDLVLACAVGAVMALPLLLAVLCGSRQRVPHVGAGGRLFDRQALTFGDGAVGRLLKRLGASRWPDLLHIAKGDLSWVGPRPRSLAETGLAHPPAVRPGLVNSWFVRSRTAVAFGTEDEADAEDLRRRGVRPYLGLLARGALAIWLPAPARVAATPGKVRLCDVVFDNVDMPGALAQVEQLLDQPGARQVCFVNPACINIAARHRGYRRVLSRAALVLPDGIGTKIAADILGTPLKQNVNGTDLFPRLMDRMAQRRGSVFLLGGRPGVAEAVAKAIVARWPEVRLAGVRDGFFAVADEGDVAAEVRRSGADLLLVARGAPLQELFIHRHLDALGARVVIGVGGLFDFVSGRIPRAPQWMRDVGLEWIYRLLQEPARMWRRYLLGNFSFLARVLLQRLRLRRPAQDLEPEVDAPEPGQPAVDASVHAVVFATSAAAADLPVAGDLPAALLPLAHTSAIEYQIEQLALAGVTHIDVVVCHGPEQIRRRVQAGQRWGTLVKWHLAKDPERPYEVLHSPFLRGVRRLLITHADAWIPTDTLALLAREDRIVMCSDAEGRLTWSGFASGAPQQFAAVGPDTGRLELGSALAGRTALHLRLDASACVPRLDALSLCRAQELACQGRGALSPPMSWRLTPWGAMSPQARVHPTARIEGPVWIGPGCVVEAGAVLGPRTWLSSDVIVSTGTAVSHSLVLPASYLGQGLELNQTIVNGARVHHLQHGVETVLSARDGLLLDLNRRATKQGSVAGRALGLLVLALMLPAVALPLSLRCLPGRALPWVRREVVTGRHELRPGLQLVSLRCTRPSGGRWESALGLFGVMIDVMLGRRAWFGVRARTRTEWYALRAEWQALLSQAPVGLIHAAAWADGDTSPTEGEVAADVFHAARQGLRENLRLLATCCRELRARPGRSGGDASAHLVHPRTATIHLP